MNLSEKMTKDFETYCSEHGVSDKRKEELLEMFKGLILRYAYEPGEAIGIISAQSISEPATQMTMRSYTMATQSDRLSKVTQGLPRLIEIFDARKTFEKNMSIFLKPDSNTMEDAKAVASSIKCVKIEGVISSDSIDLINTVIELELDDPSYKESVERVLKRNLKEAEIDFRGKRVIIKPKKEDTKSLRKIKDKILKMEIGGIKGIDNVIIVKEGNDWVIQTIGTNLKKVLEMKEVDTKRTRTNDMYQVAETLGIEAARNMILLDAKETLDKQGLEVDIRHLMLLADMMTYDGTIKDIGRYGISKKNSSILARANFEETKKHLINASFYGESDKLKGVVENVLIGQIPPIGTGMVKLAIDMEKMKRTKA
ncbi:MAG: DNA-directed RNA polymerase subunit A'' [Candidatus Aenigmarchaeota archaeon]|nr:DNA-directed RNA polymerase subunit A'' [Candidatus Aenigmarchaeota archaeon]